MYDLIIYRKGRRSTAERNSDGAIATARWETAACAGDGNGEGGRRTAALMAAEVPSAVSTGLSPLLLAHSGENSFQADALYQLGVSPRPIPTPLV